MPSAPWRQQVELRLTASFLRGDPKGRTSEELQRRLRSRIRSMLVHAELRKRVDQADLVRILDDPTKPIGTAFDRDERFDDERALRTKFERTLFDGYHDESAGHIFYGYPASTDLELDPSREPSTERRDGLSGYGTVILRLDGYSVDNFTFTLCDAAGITAWGELPEVAASAPGDLHWTSARRVVDGRPLSVDQVIEVRVLNQDRTEYAEVQIHQEVVGTHIVDAHLLEPAEAELVEAIAQYRRWTDRDLPFRIYDADGSDMAAD